LSIHLYRDDLPENLALGPAVALDTEAMGLHPHRDRLCLVQLSAGDGQAHLVQLRPGSPPPPRLVRLLGDPAVLKIMHFARFDLAAIQRHLGVMAAPVYCTKIASRLTRTFTDRHGLKDLCQDLLGVSLSKQQQTSDWGAEQLSEDQQRYAAADVLYLHRLKEQLDRLLIREGRLSLAEACFRFLPTRALLDLNGWPDFDVFAH